MLDKRTGRGTLRGMGERKPADFGARLVERIAAHERERRGTSNPSTRDSGAD